MRNRGEKSKMMRGTGNRDRGPDFPIGLLQEKPPRTGREHSVQRHSPSCRIHIPGLMCDQRQTGVTCMHRVYSPISPDNNFRNHGINNRPRCLMALQGCGAVTLTITTCRYCTVLKLPREIGGGAAACELARCKPNCERMGICLSLLSFMRLPRACPRTREDPLIRSQSHPPSMWLPL